MALRVSRGDTPAAAESQIYQDQFCAADVVDDESRCKFLSRNICFRDSYPVSQLQDAWPRCFAFKKSCAIVGSSGHLLNSDLGKAIDDEKHEAVIRLNGAPAGVGVYANLSEDVGLRTDIRFVNRFGILPVSEMAATNNTNGRCLFLHEGHIDCDVYINGNKKSQCHMDEECEECEADKIKCRGESQTKTPNWGTDHVIVDHNLYRRVAHELRTGSYKGLETAGLIAISYGFQHCNAISLYGFGPDCSSQYGARYYQDNEHTPDKGHNYEGEFELLKHFATHGARGLPVHGYVERWLHTQTLKINVPKCWKGSKFWPDTDGKSLGVKRHTKIELGVVVNYV